MGKEPGIECSTIGEKAIDLELILIRLKARPDLRVQECLLTALNLQLIVNE